MLLDLSVKGDAKPKRLALVQEIQHHVLTRQVLHIDLHEVAETKKSPSTSPSKPSARPSGSRPAAEPSNTSCSSSKCAPCPRICRRSSPPMSPPGYWPGHSYRRHESAAGRRNHGRQTYFRPFRGRPGERSAGSRPAGSRDHAGRRSRDDQREEGRGRGRRSQAGRDAAVKGGEKAPVKGAEKAPAKAPRRLPPKGRAERPPRRRARSQAAPAAKPAGKKGRNKSWRICVSLRDWAIPAPNTPPPGITSGLCWWTVGGALGGRLALEKKFQARLARVEAGRAKGDFVPAADVYERQRRGRRGAGAVLSTARRRRF